MRSTNPDIASDGAAASALFYNAQSAIEAFLDSPSLDAAAAASFGAGVTGAALTQTVRGFQHKGWPTLELVDEEVLRGARGAYDAGSDTIYLSRQFLASAGSAAVTSVLVEEIGHAIDARVNSVDAAGDEGEIFSRFVLGDAPDAEMLDALQAQNDHTTIALDGHTAAVELAAPVVGTITLDGSLSDWTAADAIDRSGSTNAYDIYGKATGGSYVFALKAPVAIGANTTAWFNTDQNVATGFKIFGEAGGAEFNVNFDATGTPKLYSGNAGATLVSGALSFGYSADKTVVEFAVPTSAIGSPRIVGTLWDVNDGPALPGSYWGPQYDVIDPAGLPVCTDFTKKIGIVYSDTSAPKYFGLADVDLAKTAYSQLFMAAQNQAAMAGVHYDILTESDLTNLSKLVNYDALLFPNFTFVQSSQVGAIETNLKLAVEHYKIGLIASGDFMTNNQNGAALPVDPYERMETLFDLQPNGGGFGPSVNVTITAVNNNPVMQDYTTGEVIHAYTGAGWLSYNALDPATTTVFANQNVNGTISASVQATTPGGRNVHFSTDEVMSDNNLLWQAIDYAVNGTGVTAGLQLSRNASIVAARNDMDQAMERLDIRPENGGPGIYDKLVPILQQWKNQYDFVGSYYIDIGQTPPDQQTVWSQSGVYYEQILDMGNEIGSHSTTHPENTNNLTAAQIRTEFEGSKQIIEQQMSQFLGRPFTVDGAAVPGASEKLSTALAIIQYYDYLSGGFSGIGAGFPGAFGYLTPAMAAADRVYLAPNVQFDFTLVEFKGMTATQASAEWQREWNELTGHGDVPILLWPWHDYAGADWPTNPPADSPYTTQMFTDFIARAYAAGTEFVTLADLADRISGFSDSSTTWSLSGNTVTATVTSTDAGRFALDLDNLGSQRIASVSNWYAYDNDSVFLDRDGGTFTITLGSAATDVTHITALPMRADLVALTGNGTNLTFTVVGEGDVVIDLVALAGRTPVVTGASVVSLNGEILTLDLGAIGTHNVSVTLGSAPANSAPVITSNGGGATASVSVAENTTAVTTVVATDSDAGQTLTYAIAGGADAARFSINAQTGALSFLTAPDFETPTDAGANNIYNVIVSALDSAGGSDAQALNVTVTNAAGSTLTGTNLPDTLTGTPEADTILGLGGNDRLTGSLGNDTISGGAGLDTAFYAGARSLYVVTHGAGTVGVTGPDGSDTLSGVERLQFNDVLMRLDQLVDFNADGKSDLVLQNKTTGTVEVLQMDGVNTGAFRDYARGTQWHVLSAQGDFNGDGKSDLVWHNKVTGTVQVQLMDGVNATTSSTDYPWSTQWQVLSTGGDFNADGKSDLVWRNNVSGTVEVLLMDGSNAIGYRDYAWSTQWNVVSAAGDFNGDGKSDLVWRNASTGTTEILQMDGTGYTTYRDYAWNQWQVVTAEGDFNGDGKNDLVWRNNATGTTEILLMDGVNHTTYRDYAWSSQWRVASAEGDFNGDGKSDLVWQNSSTGVVEVMLMDGVNWTAYRDYALGTQAQVLSAGVDFNADSKSDLVWLDPATGTVHVQLMDGANVVSSHDYAWSQWEVLNPHSENLIV